MDVRTSRIAAWVVLTKKCMQRARHCQIGISFCRYYLRTYATNCKDPSVLRPSFLTTGALTAGVIGTALAFPEQSTPYIGYLASALVWTTLLLWSMCWMSATMLGDTLHSVSPC